MYSFVLPEYVQTPAKPLLWCILATDCQAGFSSAMSITSTVSKREIPEKKNQHIKKFNLTFNNKKITKNGREEFINYFY